MNRWLWKTEPDDYSFADLIRDGGTLWGGVRNAAAQKHLRAARPGDAVVIYHTGKEKAVVGLAEVTGEPVPDPADPAGKCVAVPVKPIRPFADDEIIPLAQFKAMPELAAWELVTQPRLSAMPVPEEAWRRIAGDPEPGASAPGIFSCSRDSSIQDSGG